MQRGAASAAAAPARGGNGGGGERGSRAGMGLGGFLYPLVGSGTLPPPCAPWGPAAPQSIIQQVVPAPSQQSWDEERAPLVRRGRWVGVTVFSASMQP